mgnify:CR=1 FL=1
MIELKDVVYCRLGTADLAGAEWFAVNILGLEVSERRRGATYFKSDAREHTLCYFEGDPQDQVTAFEIGSPDDLQRAAATLEGLGHRVHYGSAQECDARHVREFIRFSDPTGNGIEFVVRPKCSAGPTPASATPALPASPMSGSARRMPSATRPSGRRSAMPAFPTASAMRR